MVRWEKGKRPDEQQIWFFFWLVEINCFVHCLSANIPDKVHQPVEYTYVCCEGRNWKSTTKYSVSWRRRISVQTIISIASMGEWKSTLGDCPPLFWTLFCHVDKPIQSSNSKFDKYRKRFFRSYREAVASYRYPIPEGVHRKSKLSS